MPKPLRVALIGASQERGWAKISHVPALQRLDGIELAAVSAREPGAANALAEALGAGKGFADVRAMINDPGIDVVAVSVRVPNHRELVLQALSAGKHVYCEWPLGRTTGESEEMRNAAAAAGVHAVIGLQARANPALRQASKMIATGVIGRVLSARMVSETIAFGPATAEADSYLDDPANGATQMTIHAGHGIDAVIAVLGGLTDVAVLASMQFPTVEVTEPARTLRRTIPDHIVLQSRLQYGGVVSAEFAGGRPNPRFRFEVVGDRGVVVLQGAALRGFQSGRLSVSLNGIPHHIDDGELADLPDAAFNVGAMYARLRDNVARGLATAPDFEHAARLTSLIADMSSADERGTRMVASDRWPTSIESAQAHALAGASRA